MNFIIDAILNPPATACPRCGGQGSIPDHTCRGDVEADAYYIDGKLVWTFTTSRGRVLTAKRVERDRLQRQLRLVRKAMREAAPLKAVEKSLLKRLAGLA